MLSPDGKWVWDGTRWLPLADPSTASHHAVFAAWNAVRIEAPVGPEPVRPVPVQVRAAPPVVTYATPPVEADVTPLWRQQPDTGLNKYLYTVAGVIGVIVLALVVNSFGPITLPWMQNQSSSPKAASGPPPLAARSGYAQASRFIALLTPAMDDMDQRVLATRETCVGPVTISCQDALTESDNQAQTLLAIIDHETVPSCIAAPVARLRADVSAAHDDLQATLKSFAGNNTFQTNDYISRDKSALQGLGPEAAAISAAKPTCDVALIGP